MKNSKITINLADLDQELLSREISEREELEKLRDNFWEFAKYWDSTFFHDGKVLLKEIAETLQQVEEDKLDYVIISIYPRAGKSYLISLFCVWMLGKYAEDCIMRNTYGANLYEKFSHDIRDMVQDKRASRVFDKMKLSPKRTSLDGWSLTTAKQLSYFGAGFGGACTGFGANLLAIVDDPFKNMQDALSPTIRELVWDWYKSVHRARRENTGARGKCPEIIIGTRWHREDLIGKLIATEGVVEECGRWKVFKFPALDENDVSTCEAMKTTESLVDERTSLIAGEQDFIWYSEYQQEPVDKYGTMFPADSLSYFDAQSLYELGKFEGCPALGYLDIADEGSNYTAGVIGVLYEGKMYIVDIIYTKQPYETTKILIYNQIKKYKPDLYTIESNKDGRILKVELQAWIERDNEEVEAKISAGEDLYHELINTNLVAKNNHKNKESRIFLSSHTIITRMCFRKDITDNLFYKNAIKHLTNYLVEGKNEYDDIEDCLAGLSQSLKNRLPVNAKIYSTEY